MKLKKLTVANLKKDGACEAGMEWITPLIKAKDAELNRKLFEHNSQWWGWAAGHGYSVWDGVEDLLPQHERFKVFVLRAMQLTDKESCQLHAARDAAWDAARDAAWDAAWYAAWYAARYAAWDAARYAAWYAALALLMRDQIGEHGFTQDHYDTLTKPWRTVIGRVHPDDEVLHG